MSQTTSDINVNLADECKRLRAHVNQLEGILEHSESENDALRARVDRLEAETVKLALECGAEGIDTFEYAIEYLRWYTSATGGHVTSPGIAIKGWPMSGFVNYKKQQRESD